MKRFIFHNSSKEDVELVIEPLFQLYVVKPGTKVFIEGEFDDSRFSFPEFVFNGTNYIEIWCPADVELTDGENILPYIIP